MEINFFIFFQIFNIKNQISKIIAIFLLLNDSSHDSHFSTCQNMASKIQIFSSPVFLIFDFKHDSPENYSDFFFSLFFFSPIEGYAFSRSQLFEGTEQSDQIFADMLRGDFILVRDTFWAISDKRFRRKVQT